MRTTDMRGSSFCVSPMERHEFAGEGFECSECGRPRALHVGKEFSTIPSDADPAATPIRSPSFSLALRGKLLDDKRIAEYEAKGYYSLEFQAARRELWRNQSARKKDRKSNFESMDGRLIYRP